MSSSSTATGTGLRRVTRTAAREANPVWAPHGGRLAYEGGRTLASVEIFIQNADGSARRRLTENSVPDVEPAFAPGGSRIAFTRYVRGRGPEIYVIRADGAGIRRLTANRFPDHHPDGRRKAGSPSCASRRPGINSAR